MESEGTVSRLRQRKPKPQDELPLVLPKKKPPKSGAERSKQCYNRMKEERPQSYATLLETQKLISKTNRESFKRNATEEEKAAKRLKDRERKRKSRLALAIKDKSDTSESVKRHKPVTRKEAEKVEETRQKDRERKRNERSQWTSQKRVAENKKALKRYYDKKEEACPKTRTDVCVGNGGERTQEARKQAVYRLNKALPVSPRKRQQTMDDFVRAKTRRTETTPSLTEVILSEQGVDSREQMQLKRLMAKKLQFMPQVVKELNLRPAAVKKMAMKSSTTLRCPSAKAIRDAKSVHTFFMEISRTLPFKKGASRGAKKVLDDTLENLYSNYLKENPTVTVSFSFFCKHRPKCVKTQQFVKFNQALCEICENIELKLKALNAAGVLGFGRNRQELQDLMLCPSETHRYHYKMPCISLECSLCGPKILFDQIPEDDRRKEISYSEWGLKEVRRGEHTVRRKALCWTTATLDELKDKLIDEFGKFPLHFLRAKWQYQQFLSKKKNLRRGELLAVLDFAENYRCSSQDEAQSAHWNYLQVTLHPIVFSYICGDCDSTVTEAVIIVSDDLQHDAAAVQVFTKSAVDHVIKSRGTFDRFIQFSDGCASQYKSRQPFQHIQDSWKKIGIPIERHFFGSRHGKNPSDGEAAVVKSAASRAVKCRRSIIQTPEDFFLYGTSKLSLDGDCQHYKRQFIFVDSQSVEKERSLKSKAVKTLVGTRALHVVKANQGKLLIRNLSCFCDACEASNPLHCTEKDYVYEWQKHDMFSKMRKSTQKSKTSPIDEEPLHELSASTLNILQSLDLTDPSLSLSWSVEEPGNEVIDKVENDDSTQPTSSGEGHTQKDANAFDCKENEMNDDSTQQTSSGEGHTQKDAFDCKENEMNDDSAQPTSSGEGHTRQDANAFDCKENETKLLKISPGTWVMASFPGKAMKTYIGLVLTVEEDEANVKFCRQGGKFFTWPIVDDIGWMPLYSLSPVEAPTLDSRERMLFPAHVMDKLR